jgi:hypothetical protein
MIEFPPQRVLRDQGGNGLFQFAHLPFQHGQQFGEGVLHDRLGDEPKLVALRSAHGGKLAQACDQRAQLLLAG